MLPSRLSGLPDFVEVSRFPSDGPVRIRRDWNDHRIGTVRWSDLENPRWDVISGGEQNPTPQPFITAYCASKGALATLTKNAAHALRGDRIRVNGINPGWVA